jgi:HAD superfamily phosphatase (TIGR01668 family)
MRHPGSGTFKREEMPKPLARIAPSGCIESLVDIDLDALKAEGRTLILLDVDNTLVHWKSEDFDPEVLNWLEKGKNLGFRFCILSNTRHPERLMRIGEKLGIECKRGRFKPHPEMYLSALKDYGASPDQAVMVGDQLLTDVLGANRSGIDAIWVQRMSRKEFVGTKVVSRNVERLVGLALRKWFQSDEDAKRPGFFQRSVVKQLLKFAVVGGTATVVDVVPHYYLLNRMMWEGELLRDRIGRWVGEVLGMGVISDPNHLSDLAWMPTKIGPVLLAICVSYVLNFLWTFRQQDAAMTVKQAGKFYIVALIGMAISLVASTLVKSLIHGEMNRDWAIATIAGIVAGFAWNFNAQRLWTFRAQKQG